MTSHRKINYSYQATKTFWKAFNSLPDTQKESIREKWKIFKINPFDPRLKTHKIYKLSGIAKQTIYSIFIENNLRVIFRIDADTVTTLDIGDHSIYK